MIISTILFLISLAFVGYMFAVRQKDLGKMNVSYSGDSDTGISIPTLRGVCCTKLDHQLRDTSMRFVRFLKSFKDKKQVADMLHKFAARAERFSLVCIARVVNKFSKARDIVTGKDLPKNKGSVSFFLRTIKHK